MNTIAKKMILEHEGRKSKLYQDTVGLTTIGVGYNLADKGLPDWVIDALFEQQLLTAELDCARLFPTFFDLSEVRQAVLIDMMYNLGLPRLAGFRMMGAALDKKPPDFAEAASQMMDSTWAKQVGKRAADLSKLMRGDAA